MVSLPIFFNNEENYIQNEHRGNGMLMNKKQLKLKLSAITISVLLAIFLIMKKITFKMNIGEMEC